MRHFEDQLLTCIRIAVEAGEAALEIYEQDFEVVEKDDHSPLTLADRRSHEIIAEGLKASGIPVLSEEGREIPYERRKQWQTLWIVDPLDGTKEFVKKNGEFTINIARVVQGRPDMGIIFVPVRNLLYFAAEDLGAFRLDRGAARKGWDADVDSVMASATALPLTSDGDRPYTVVGSRSHPTPELEAFVAEKRKVHERLEFVSAGSSLKFCLVAEGHADIYPRLGPTMEWDTAAGQAIAQQAGASVCVHETGEPLVYNKANLKNPWFIVSRE